MQAELLRGLSFLRDLSTDELDAFSALLDVRECKTGERILQEGEAPTAFYIVCDGIVHVRRRANTREMLMGRIGVGGFFGEINLFDRGLATASIIAMKSTRLAVISYDRFLKFMEEHPRAGYRITSNLMGQLAQRLRSVSSRLVNAVFWAQPLPQE
jgi:CRP-like cAMP-binding protein